VGPRAVLDAVVKRKIPSPLREWNPRTPIVQPVAHLCTTELSRFLIMNPRFAKHEFAAEAAAILILWCKKFHWY
jgi:hypothetical protein